MESLDSKKRILILGDSLSLPRKLPEVVSLDHTWPFMLKSNTQYEIIQLSLGGATLQNLYEQSAYYEACEPDIVVIQSGIVDCAPRALRWIEKEIVKANRLLGFVFHRLMPINLMRKYRKITYTKRTDFENIINKLANRFSNSNIIWVGIVPANNNYEKLVPGISKNINTYNGIIAKEIFKLHGNFLNTNDMPKEGIMSDYHHLNHLGQKWIYEQILILLSLWEH